MFLFGRRKVLTIGVFAVGAALGVIYGLSSMVVSNFEEGCSLIGGALQPSNSFLYGREPDISMLCQVVEFLEQLCSRSFGSSLMEWNDICSNVGFFGNH